jgi:hypothetical protein
MSLPFLTMCLSTTDTILIPISVLQAQLGDSKLIKYFVSKSVGSGLLPARPNPKEKEYFIKHPIDSVRGALAAAGALLKVAKEYPDSVFNGKGDAIRHCYWSSQLYRDLDESSATEILENHESDNTDPTGYDPHNNAVGREVGLGSDLSNDDLWKQCKVKAEDGNLHYDGSSNADNDGGESISDDDDDGEDDGDDGEDDGDDDGEDDGDDDGDDNS